MNRNYAFAITTACLLLALLLATPMAAQPFGNGPGNGAGPGHGNGPGSGQGLGVGPGAGFRIDPAPLTAAEAATAAFMREEERMSRDLYLKLAEKWNLTVFRHIASSEQKHFEAIGNILTNKNLPDPSAGKQAGVYAEPRLNTFYNELIAKGLKSIEDALAVGVAVETADIADLEAALKATTRTDLKRVYTNLMNASYNHLDAFNNNIELVCPRVPAN